MHTARTRTFRKRLIRLCCGMWTGVALLAALTVYVAVASILQATTDGVINLYRNPLLIVLSAALCANMLAATFLRVPTTAAHVGAFLAHGGVVILAAGACTFAFARVHGELLALRTPDGWTEVNAFHVADSHAVYLAQRHEREFEQNRFEPASLASGETLRLEGAIEGTDVRAIDYSAETALQPMVQLGLIEDGRERGVLLSAGADAQTRIETDAYVLAYRPDVTAAAAEGFIDAIGPVQGAPEGKDVLLIVTGDDLPPTLLFASADGGRARVGLEIGASVKPVLSHGSLTLRLDALVFRPPQQPAPDAPTGPAVAVRIATGDWETTTWVPFADFLELAEPERLDTPAGAVFLQYSRRLMSLGGVVKIHKSEYLTQPGSVVPRDFRCEVEVETGDHERQAVLGLNRPLRMGPLQISQGSWTPDPRHPMRIQLFVSSRPGLNAVWIGCGLIVAGLVYAFYVKPLVLRRRECGT